MGATPDAGRRKVAREATEWFLLLSEEPDDRKLRRAFEEWRESSPLNAEVWASTLHMSEMTRQATSVHRGEWPASQAPLGDAAGGGRTTGYPATRTARAAVRPKRPAWSRGARWKMAFAAAALACAVAFFAPAAVLQIKSDYSTSTAEIRTVSLEDGSQVTLAPGSAIALSFTVGERRVQLLSGEAFFDVGPNPRRPFRVEAGSVETSVVGTRFNVRRDPDGVTVSVEEGAVEVGEASRQRSMEKLQKGQSAHLTWGGRIATSRQGLDVVAAWRQGLLLSDDEPLRNAVAQLSRYYSGTIVMADSSLGERPVTGVFKMDDPEAALRAIAQAHGAQVHRISPWLLVLSGT